MKEFPNIITKLPAADIPIRGLNSRLLQGENSQVLFMIFDQDVNVPEHSHAAQWGSFWMERWPLPLMVRKQYCSKETSTSYQKAQPTAPG